MKQANLRSLPKEDLEHCSRLTEAIWKEHPGARIFLTGGTGFFGKWLQETFTHANSKFDLGATLVVLTRDAAKAKREMGHLSAGVEYVSGDVRSFEFPKGPFTHVIHAATPVQGLWSPKQALETLDITYHGTKRVLEFAATQTPTRLLLVSSGGVYGPQPQTMAAIPESHHGGPDSASPKMAYSEGKRVAETLTHLSGLNHSIARCFAFTGPHLAMDAGFASSDFLDKALRKVSIQIKGTGEDLRSFMHPADLSVWLWTILFRGKNGEIYNVGSDEAVSIAELARKIQPLGATGVEILGRPGDNSPSRYVPDVTKAKRELGLEIGIGLDEALRRTFDWLKA